MKYFVAVFVALFFSVAIAFLMSNGSGGLKRMTTLSGIYTVCQPGGYNVVCFADKGSPQGGIFCIPLSDVGGECR